LQGNPNRRTVTPKPIDPYKRKPDTMNKHAPFAPSALERTMACPGSYRLSKDIPSTTSSYAERGTLLHSLASMLITDRVRVMDRYVKKEGIQLEPIERAALLLYARHCRKLARRATYFGIEQPLRLNDEVWGTADFFAVCKDTLHVTDLKTGSGVFVSPEDNPQLLCYGLMAYRWLPQHLQRGIDYIELTIVQPLFDGVAPVRSVRYPIEYLSEWRVQLLDAVNAAKQIDAAVIPGDHCRFCPARPTCPALTGLVQAMPSPVLYTSLTPAQLSEWLTKADAIEGWIRALRELAHEAVAKGITVPGWKLVDKRATRKWADEKEVLRIAKTLGINAQQLKTISPAQLAQRHGCIPPELAPLIDQTPSGQNLVHDPSTENLLTNGASPLTPGQMLRNLKYNA
jgi:hypothetical protein